MSDTPSLFDDTDFSAATYPAKCKKCGFNWVGKDAYDHPDLTHSRCFWCDGQLRAHRGEKDFAVADKRADTRRSLAAERIFGYVVARDENGHAISTERIG